MSYPTSIDSIPQPSPTSPTNNPSASGVSVAQTTAIVALETKVGTGSSTATSGTLLRGTGTGTTAFAQANLTTDVTGTLPVANGGTGNTTGTATVNANLTGVITSVGNATSIASQTGTGSKIVVDTSPTLNSPVISSIVNTGTLTLPTSTDTLIGQATTDTLTNKSISGSSNTLTNIPVSAIATSSGAWGSWTPTWTNLSVGTSPTTDYKYIQIGKTVHYRIQLKMGTSPSVTNNPIFTLPVPPNVSVTTYLIPIGTAAFSVGTGGSVYLGYVLINEPTNSNVILYALHTTDPVSAGSMSSTLPFTWTAGSIIVITGTYEAA